MGINLIIGGVLLLCALGGGGLLWHSIGASAVAKHDQEVKIEQDKADAAAKAIVETKTAEEEKWLVNLAAQHDIDVADAEAKAKTKQGQVKTYTAATPVFQIKECEVPPDGMSLLNAELAKTAAHVLGLPEPAAVVIKTPPVVVVPQSVMVPAGRPPKPVPIGATK